MFTTDNILGFRFEGLDDHPSGHIDVSREAGEAEMSKAIVTIRYPFVKGLRKPRRFKVTDSHAMGDGIRVRFHVEAL
jgi:hypothetical protein